MDNRIDVEKELQEKNREIFYNKLNMDIDSNSESLNITLTNVINKLMNELASKLLEIKKADINRIDELVENFKQKLLAEINILIINRRQNLHKEIQKENFDYKEILEKEKDIIIERINNLYQGYLTIIMQLSEEYSDFELKRLKVFLNVIFFEKLILKIREELDFSNTCLNNIYVANVNKFEKLNDIKVR